MYGRGKSDGVLSVWQGGGGGKDAAAATDGGAGKGDVQTKGARCRGGSNGDGSRGSRHTSTSATATSGRCMRPAVASCWCACVHNYFAVGDSESRHPCKHARPRGCQRWASLRHSGSHPKERQPSRRATFQPRLLYIG